MNLSKLIDVLSQLEYDIQKEAGDGVEVAVPVIGSHGNPVKIKLLRDPETSKLVKIMLV